MVVDDLTPLLLVKVGLLFGFTCPSGRLCAFSEIEALNADPDHKIARLEI